MCTKWKCWVCTKWGVEYVPVEFFFECKYSMDMLNMYVLIGNVEYVPGGNVEYGYLVEVLR